MVKNKVFDEYRKYEVPRSQIYADYNPPQSKD
jgi:hypothetical protein